jgi:hypothetical protein
MAVLERQQAVAGVTSSASVVRGAIPTVERVGARCGEAFSRSSVRM